MSIASPAQAWPEEVIARYLTVAGATVDITAPVASGRYQRAVAACTGCTTTRDYEWATYRWGQDSRTWVEFRDATTARLDAEKDARGWAQEHAEHCRALPMPPAPAPVPVPAPVPDPGEDCRCVWRGGICVETCPGHTTDAWMSRLLARLNGRAGR
ncbi:hypothetical protein Ppa06_64560 [Planomonospora parontospora subsp. parontospora]|uniref:Uncharacterized protein n=2 Tax=Planomonospora parontospora TaxID=58119 RepID=A0AA37F7N2_9ACTN|nr:hypothetical protein [Planomonospora parontospora]GGK94238.1 hypothetical protein GCM10010126_62020 [Planomonospora parontospora]GII12658.1 hypothetical protein Ppa06_64560 [Planomonospora parontospora subsp. parontospora]